MSIGTDISNEGRAIQEEISGESVTLTRTGASFVVLTQPASGERGENVLHREESGGDSITIRKSALGTERIRPGDYLTTDAVTFRVLTVDFGSDLIVTLKVETVEKASA
jgi:voltage-gated potassium channel Kch